MSKEVICLFCNEPVTDYVLETEDKKHVVCAPCLLGGTLDIYGNLKSDGIPDIDIFNYIQGNMGTAIIRTIEKVKRKEDFELKLTPKEIFAELDKYVVDQEHAKKVLAVAAYNHYKRLGYEDDTLQGSNVLLLGPTGTGKTFLIQILSKILDVPMILVDATSFTERGYVGESVDDIVKRLYEAAGKNAKAAQKGIIYIDELDKIAGLDKTANSQKDLGLGLQYNLLKLLEGAEFTVQDGARQITIDTTDVLFIAGGAFNSINENEKVSHDDIKEFGLIPELLGRLPIITQTKKLSNDALVKILKDSEGSLVKHYKVLYSIDGVDLNFTDEAFGAIANMANEKQIGARGLKTVVEEIMLDLTYEAPSIPDLATVNVDFDGKQITRNFIKQKTIEIT